MEDSSAPGLWVEHSPKEVGRGASPSHSAAPPGGPAAVPFVGSTFCTLGGVGVSGARQRPSESGAGETPVVRQRLSHAGPEQGRLLASVPALPEAKVTEVKTGRGFLEGRREASVVEHLLCSMLCSAGCFCVL